MRLDCEKSLCSVAPPPKANAASALEQVDYLTFLGGSDSDEANAVTVDGLGFTYVTGQSRLDHRNTVNRCTEKDIGSPAGRLPPIRTRLRRP